MPRWQDLRDPHNPENRVAGSVSDLLKHSAYLVALDELFPGGEPGAPGTIYECHAGRGMYFIPRDDPRREHLTQLDNGIVHTTRQSVLARLGASTDWYPGSAALIAQRLHTNNSTARHLMLEWAPDTRAVLRQVCRDMNHKGELIEDNEETRFDGESYVASNVRTMTPKDLVLLDPFALFRQQKLHYRRERYLRFFQRWLEHEHSRPNVLWFFCAPATMESVSGDPPQRIAPPSYEDFRALLSKSDGLKMSYAYEFPCELWFFFEAKRLDTLAAKLAKQMDALQASLGRDLHVRLVRRP